MQNFRALGAPFPDPRASGGWGLRPHTPKTAPPHSELLATRLNVTRFFVEMNHRKSKLHQAKLETTSSSQSKQANCIYNSIEQTLKKK